MTRCHADHIELGVLHAPAWEHFGPERYERYQAVHFAALAVGRMKLAIEEDRADRWSSMLERVRVACLPVHEVMK